MPVSLNKSGKISWRSWRLGGYCSRMATLIFDIETTALPLELFDEAQQEYLFREAEKLGDALAKAAKREEITKFMSLWPFTSKVVCIAMLNAETQRGQTIYISDDFEDGQIED